MDIKEKVYRKIIEGYSNPQMSVEDIAKGLKKSKNTIYAMASELRRGKVYLPEKGRVPKVSKETHRSIIKKLSKEFPIPKNVAPSKETVKEEVEGNPPKQLSFWK